MYGPHADSARYKHLVLSLFNFDREELALWCFLVNFCQFCQEHFCLSPGELSLAESMIYLPQSETTYCFCKTKQPGQLDQCPQQKRIHTSFVVHQTNNSQLLEHKRGCNLHLHCPGLTLHLGFFSTLSCFVILFCIFQSSLVRATNQGY